MARLLNQGVLAPGFYAVPLVDRDGPIALDVAAPQTWAPPAPGLTVAVVSSRHVLQGRWVVESG